MRVVPAHPEGIGEAVAALSAGQLVAMPTETVYGLAADAANPHAIAAIYAVKGRPSFNPLIAHVADAAMATEVVRFDDRALALAKAFWPGPLTIVAPRLHNTAMLCDLACAGLETAAVRAPAHTVAQALIAGLGRPICAPSANPSGRISPTSAAHVAADQLDGVAMILDGGPSALGLESTIIACLPGHPAALLRPGALPSEAVEAVIGPLAPAGPMIHAPGMLESHYAPRARLRLNALTRAPDEILIGFGATADAGVTLSKTGDLTEAAANLYATLRAADASGASVIAVAPIPHTGLGAAINDRLRRAAAPR
jgi:L-threonylcarbamoyladenylate synthase